MTLQENKRIRVMVWNFKQTMEEKPNVKHELTLITPEMASDLLKLNTKNRKISKASVYQYRRDMENGHFKYNGDTICVSDTNVLLDGQQRLMASVEAKKSFWTILVNGLDESAMVTINTGRKRTFANQLQIRGYTNASLASATVSQLGLIAIGSPKNISQFTMSDLDKILDKNPELHDSVSFAKGTFYHNALLAAIHYIGKQTGYDDEADTFIKTYKDGQKNYENDPVVFMREKILRDNGRLKKMTQEHKQRLIMLSWNKFCRGETLQQAKVSSNGFRMEGWTLKKCGLE